MTVWYWSFCCYSVCFFFFFFLKRLAHNETTDKTESDIPTMYSSWKYSQDLIVFFPDSSVFMVFYLVFFDSPHYSFPRNES